MDRAAVTGTLSWNEAHNKGLCAVSVTNDFGQPAGVDSQTLRKGTHVSTESPLLQCSYTSLNAGDDRSGDRASTASATAAEHSAAVTASTPWASKKQPDRSSDVRKELLDSERGDAAQTKDQISRKRLTQPPASTPFTSV